MAIYRDLVFSNVESFVSSNFPVIRTLYDDAAWSVFAHEFFREHHCHTPLFPEFAREFLRYLETRQQQERGDPPFLLELAHYEWAELALSLDETEIADVAHDPSRRSADRRSGALAAGLGARLSLSGAAYRPGFPSRRSARQSRP